MCNSIRLPNEDLWHQRMGRASYKHLSIVSKHKSVLGVPKLNRVNNKVCGPCQLGKQMKAKHPSTQTSATSRPLELLHPDLMGPTKIESIGGKRYIMVLVDGFTSGSFSYDPSLMLLSTLKLCAQDCRMKKA